MHASRTQAVTTAGVVTPTRRSSSWRWGWRVLAGVVAIVTLLVGASLAINEPLRRYLEQALNVELNGYTVHLAAATFNPVGLAITLKDLSIAQDAHPEPLVAHFPLLQASVHWQALLHGRLLADFRLHQPHVRINRTQLREEVSDDVALKDEGWQRALEAIYPLKINDFRIDDGDLSYVDDDPKRPLRLRAINLVAGNIRNVRSANRVYPSDLHMEAVLFDSGKVRADGQADFLAEPAPAIDVDLTLEQIELAYFKPMLARMNLWISDGTLTADGHVEYAPQVQDFHLKHLTLAGVVLDYVHSAQTALEEKARATQIGRAAVELTQARLAVLRVDELHLADSTIGYVDHSFEPGYRVFVDHADLLIKNVSNQAADGSASAKLSGKLMGSGSSTVHAIVGPATASPDLDVWVTIEEAQLRSMNNVLRTFGNFDVVAGRFTFYSQISIKEGEITGYVKPIFTDMQVYSHEQDAKKSFLNRLYEGAVGGAQTILQNRRGEVATTAIISGRASDPETSTWALAIGLIKNAFVEAVAHGFERGAKAPGDEG